MSKFSSFQAWGSVSTKEVSTKEVTTKDVTMSAGCSMGCSMEKASPPPAVGDKSN